MRPHVGDVRGLGLFVGIELVRDRDIARARPGGAARRSAERPSRAASSWPPPGRFENVVKISPPLTIDEEQLDAAVDVVIEAIGALRMIETEHRRPRGPQLHRRRLGAEQRRRRSRAATRRPASSSRPRPRPTLDDLSAAIAAARRAFDETGLVDDGRQGRGPPILYELARLLREEQGPLAELVAREMGKPIRYVREREIEPAIDRILFYAGAARLIRGEVTSSAPGHLLNLVLKEPVGVCGLITPWNDPVDLPLRKIGAAIATGCTFVLKPASDAPASSMAIFELLDRIEALPPGVANGVVGQGEIIGEALAADPRVDKISFTGSSEVGPPAHGARRPQLQAHRDRGRRQGAGHRLPGRQPRQGDGRRRGRDLPVRRAVVHRRLAAARSTARSTTRSSTGSSSAPAPCASDRRSTRRPSSDRWSRHGSSIGCSATSSAAARSRPG